MLHKMKLRQYFFDKIKSSEKIYEIRLYDEKRKLISVGDEILFSGQEIQKETLLTEVVELKCFRTFEEMCKTIALAEIGLNGTIEDAVSVYRQFYSIEEEKQYGVIAIKIKLKKAT